MKFLEYYLFQEEPEISNTSDWREKYVYHRTPVTKQWKKVKVKSLPASEQWRYAPPDVKIQRKKAGHYVSAQSVGGEPELTSKHIFDLYYSGNRKGGYNNFDNGKLVVATDDSAKAIEIEKSGQIVAVAHMVPLEAFKKFYSYEDEDWKDFPKDINDEQKFEMIEFTDNDVYLVDFTTYKDQIEFSLSEDPDDEVQ